MQELLFALRRSVCAHSIPNSPLVDQHPLTWYMETMIWGQQRFIAALFAIFSFLGLVLAATGLYSVVSFSVGPEKAGNGDSHGAGGAKDYDILGLVLKSVASTVGVGIVVGLALSIGLNRVVAHWVQSSSRDPLAVVDRGCGSGGDCVVRLHLAGATGGNAGSR